MKPYGIITILGALTVLPCQAQEFTLHEGDYAERGKKYSPYVDEHFPQNDRAYTSPIWYTSKGTSTAAVQERAAKADG